MRIEAGRKLFNVVEYYKMAEVGILGSEERVELIDGEIIQMSPIGDKHLGCVNIANDLFTAAFRGRAVVSVQNPLRLKDYTEPEPDVVLLKPRSDRYRGKHPEAEDALLVLEIADTTLRYDREVKLSRYAKAGVPEVWIENLQDDALLVYRDPEQERFQTTLTIQRGGTVAVLVFPDVIFSVDELLG
jgi:Uma2 family endonuclease